MANEINNISLKFSCTANWDTMDWVDGAKHCAHCQKKVYDFTNAKQHEFLMILAENDHNVCGRFRVNQMVVKNPALPRWRKWISAAMILIGVNVFNNKATAQDVKTKTEKHDVKPVSGDEVMLGGISANQGVPEFPGSIEAFGKFINSHLKKVRGTNGKRVILSFMVRENGSLTDFKIERGVNKKADEEALRVMKSSPAWKPGIQNGKVVKVRYYVPIGFK